MQKWERTVFLLVLETQREKRRPLCQGCEFPLQLALHKSAWVIRNPSPITRLHVSAMLFPSHLECPPHPTSEAYTFQDPFPNVASRMP